MHTNNASNSWSWESMGHAAVLALHGANQQPFEVAVAEHDQYRYIINLDERGEFSATLYPILPNGEDGEPALEIDTHEAAFLFSEGVDVRDATSLADYHRGMGLLPVSACVIGASDDPVMVDPTNYPVWEYLSVDVVEALRLRARGEVVIEHPGLSSGDRGHLIWCRDCRSDCARH